MEPGCGCDRAEGSKVGVYEVVREEVEYASTSISKVKLTKFARPDSKERGVWKMEGGVWKTKIL